MAPAEKHQANARASAKKGKVFHEDCQFYWNNMVICDADQYFSLDRAQLESGGQGGVCGVPMEQEASLATIRHQIKYCPFQDLGPSVDKNFNCHLKV